MATAKTSKTLIYVAVGALVLLVLGGLVYVISKMTGSNQQAPAANNPPATTPGSAYVPGKGFQIAGSVIGGLEGVSGIFLDFWNTFKSTKNNTTAEYTTNANQSIDEGAGNVFDWN